jgi:hypothetical protein
MRWLEQLRRRRDDRKRHRDEKKKQSLRPRIAEAVRTVIPSTGPVLIQAIGDVYFPPWDQPSPWSVSDRRASAWRSSHGHRSYIIATDQHLIVVRQRSHGEADLSLPLASIGTTRCRHNPFVYVPMVYSNVMVPEHVEIWIDLPDRAGLRFKVSRPWLSEAKELCATLRAVKEPSDFW